MSRPLRTLIVTVSALVVAIVLSAVVVTAFLLSGPIDVSFLRGRLAGELEERLAPGHAIAVERAAVRIDGDLGFVVEIDDVQVVDTRGTVIASIPTTRMALDPFRMLFGTVAVRSILVRSPQVSLVRTASGGILLGDGQAPDHEPDDSPANGVDDRPILADGGFPDLADLLHATDRFLGASTERAIAIGLSDLKITGATVSVWDQLSRQERRIADTDIDIAVDPQSGALAAHVSTAGHKGRWTAALSRTKEENGGHRVTLDFAEISVSDLLAQRLENPAGALPLFGEAVIEFSGAGVLGAAALHMDVGAGLIDLGEGEEPVLLDEATLRVRWDMAGQRMIIEPSSFHAGRTAGTVGGWVRPAEGTDDPRYSFSLESSNLVLSSRDSESPPMRADRLTVVGSVEIDRERLEIDDLTIRTGQGALALRGTIGFAGAAPSFALAASVSPMPIASFKQLWPPFVAPGARRWAIANIDEGRVVSGTFEASAQAGLVGPKPLLPDDVLRLDLRLEDAVLRTIGGLPPLSDVSANVVLAGATLGVDVESGRIDAPSGEIVAVDAAAFAIDDVFDPMPIGAVEVELSGSARALGALADSEPLLVLSRRDLDPDDLAGTASAAISLRLPLEKEEHELADAMDWKVVVHGTGLGSTKPVEGRVFSDADVTISVTREAVAASGTAVIDGVRADVSMQQSLGGDGDAIGRGQQFARMVLDAAMRRKLGLDLEDMLEGTVVAQVSGLADGDGQHYDLDLEPVRLTIPGLGWTKGIGVPAALSFDLVPAESGHVLENIVMEGEGFGLSGTARIVGDGRLVAADIEDFALRPGDSLSFQLRATEAGYAIAVDGSRFDARGLITDFTTSDNGGALPDLTITAQIDRVTGFNEGTVENLRGRFRSTGGSPVEVAVGATQDALPISVTFLETPAGASLRASTRDAGQLLRFLDVYTRLGGGWLDLVADRQGPAGLLAGQVTVDDFVILEEPTVEQVILSGSAAARIDTSRLHFDHMLARFGLGTDAVFIEDAVLRGQAVGATFSGYADFKNSQVRINGTYLPLYAVNNVFSRVPVIGRVLGGAKGEGGLIGVTFRVEGQVAQPRVLINPLSAVAPGIFRKIFEFR